LQSENQEITEANQSLKLIWDQLYREINVLRQEEENLKGSISRLELRNKPLGTINMLLEQKIENNREVVELINLFKWLLLDENNISTSELQSLYLFLQNVYFNRMLGVVNTVSNNEIKKRLEQLILNIIDKKKIDIFKPMKGNLS